MAEEKGLENGKENGKVVELAEDAWDEVTDADARGPGLALKAVDSDPGWRIYRGAAEKPVSEAQAALLAADIDDDDIDVMPRGEIYATHTKYRELLNRTLRPMGWALIPLGAEKEEKGTLMQEYMLLAGGRYVERAWGEVELDRGSSDRMSLASALEAVKSDALKRCCKVLGIASKCWDRRFADAWRGKYAVEVWCEGAADGNKGKKRKLWRRKDAKPFDYPWREARSVAAATPAGGNSPEAGPPAAAGQGEVSPKTQPEQLQARRPNEVAIEILRDLKLVDRRVKDMGTHVRSAYKAEDGRVIFTFDAGKGSIADVLDVAWGAQTGVTVEAWLRGKAGYEVKRVVES